MKKLIKKQFFPAIGAGIFLLFLAILYWLKEKGWIIFPEIEKVRLYKDWAYALGAPEFFEPPRPYSRFWDIVFLPIFIYCLIWSGKRARRKSKLWILSGTMLAILLFSQCLASKIFALYAALFFVGVCGLFFGSLTAIFLSLLFGSIIGLAAFGLLFGLLFSLGAYLFYLALKFFLK